jgi:hypothetical protein
VPRVEFPVQPRQELQGLEDRSGVGQHGLHCLDRGPLGTFAKSPGEYREDRVLVALRESWSPRPPARVAGLTRFPGPQISETSGLRHSSKNTTTSSVFYHCSGPRERGSCTEMGLTKQPPRTIERPGGVSHIRDLRITTEELQKFRFDLADRVRVVEAGGRRFRVTLLSIDL